MRKVIQAGSGRAGTLLLIPNASLSGLHHLGSACFATHQDRADIKKWVTGRLQVLEPEAAAEVQSKIHSSNPRDGRKGRSTSA